MICSMLWNKNGVLRKGWKAKKRRIIDWTKFSSQRKAYKVRLLNHGIDRSRRKVIDGSRASTAPFMGRFCDIRKRRSYAPNCRSSIWRSWSIPAVLVDFRWKHNHRRASVLTMSLFIPPQLIEISLTPSSDSTRRIILLLELVVVNGRNTHRNQELLCVIDRSELRKIDKNLKKRETSKA